MSASDWRTGGNLQFKLEFNPSVNGSRRSLVWSGTGAIDKTSMLTALSPTEENTEVTLHRFDTVRLTLTVDNLPESPLDAWGYWDNSISDPEWDLYPLYNILCRVSVLIRPEATFTPIFTGIVADVDTDTDTGRATIALIGIPSILTESSAEDVKGVDSYYQSISIREAVNRILTQKDRWVPLWGDDIECTVGGVSSTTIGVTQSDVWGDDQSGQHPDGVLAGYIIRITSGVAAGAEYVIASNTGGGTPSATLTVAGDPDADGVEVGDDAIVTGWCWPFTKPEIETWNITPAVQVPTIDGSRVPSTLGVPPEDGSFGATRALAWEPSANGLWVGRDNKLFFYEPDLDKYTLMVTLTPDDYYWRFAFYDATTNYIWIAAWRQDFGAEIPPDPKLFRIRRSGQLPGQTWDLSNAVGSMANHYPGDAQHRQCRQYSFGQSGFPLNIGAVGPGVQFQSPETMVASPFPQTILAWDTSAGGLDGWVLVKGTTPYFDIGNPGEQDAPPWDTITKPWTYSEHNNVRLDPDPHPHFRVRVHLGGRYIWCQFLRSGTSWLYRISIVHTTTTRLITLHRIQLSNPVIQATIGTWSNDRRVPVAITSTAAGGSNIYVLFNNYGNSFTSIDVPRIELWRSDSGTGTPLKVWESPTAHPYDTLTLIDAGDASSFNGLGIILATLNPGYQGGGTSPWHQQWILVKNLFDTSFWTGFADGSNILYVSARPLGHIYTAVQNLGGDGRAWFWEYGTGRLWHAGNVDGEAGAGHAHPDPMVPADRALASNLAIRHDINAVYGASAGDWLDLHPGQPPQGRCLLWQYTHTFAPRIPQLYTSGLNRKEALDQVAELADYIAAWLRTGELAFVRRENGTVDWNLDQSHFARIRKRLRREEMFTQVSCIPTEPVYEIPRVRYLPARVDDRGEPIEDGQFNGSIAVRQIDSTTKRIRLICVIGNITPYGSESNPPPVTDTFWQAYNASASPQYYLDGVAQRYPGGWWEPGGHRVMVKLEDDLTIDPADRVGFAAGDVIEITCPGLVSRPHPDGQVQRISAAGQSRLKVLDLPIRNQLIDRPRAINLCALYLSMFSNDPIELTADGDLFPFYQPMDTVFIHLPRLNVHNQTGFIRSTRSDFSGCKTTIVWRRWINPTPISPAPMPAPALPPADPAVQSVELEWIFDVNAEIYSTPELTDVENSQVGQRAFVVVVAADGAVRSLRASDATLMGLYKSNQPHDGGYGHVALVPDPVSVGSGKYYVAYGAHDGYLRLLDPTLQTVLWSVRNWWERAGGGIPSGWDQLRMWQQGGSFFARTISSSQRLCLVGTCFDGRIYGIRASSGSITSPNGWELDTTGGWSPSGGGNGPHLIDDSACMFTRSGQPDRWMVCAVENQVWLQTGTTPLFTGHTFDGRVSPISAAPLTGAGQDRIFFCTTVWTGNQFSHRAMVANPNQASMPILSFVDIGAEVNTKPIIHDFDGDGRYEIVFGTDAGTVICLRWTGSTLVQVWSTAVSPGVPVLSHPCALDTNGDGRREVIVGTLTGRVFILRGTNGAIVDQFQVPGGVRIEGGITGGSPTTDSSAVHIFVPVADARSLVCFYVGDQTALNTNWHRRYGWDLYRSGFIPTNGVEPSYPGVA